MNVTKIILTMMPDFSFKVHKIQFQLELLPRPPSCI